MAKFEFDLESAECELNNVENLLSVFWGFFNEERPFGKELNTAAALWFVQSCKPYESVILRGMGQSSQGSRRYRNRHRKSLPRRESERR